MDDWFDDATYVAWFKICMREQATAKFKQLQICPQSRRIYATDEGNLTSATTNFLKIPRLRYFCLENSVSRRSIVCNYVGCFTLIGEGGQNLQNSPQGRVFYLICCWTWFATRNAVASAEIYKEIHKCLDLW